MNYNFNVQGKKHAPNYSIEQNGSQLLKCENCGIVLDEQSGKIRKDKRFCSNSCAKRFFINYLHYETIHL